MSDEQIYGFMPFNHADRPVEAMVGETAYDYNGKVLGWIVSEQAIAAWNARAEELEPDSNLLEPKRCELEETESYESCYADYDGNLKMTTIHVLECSECGRTCEHVNGAYKRCPHCGAVAGEGTEVIQNAEKYKLADEADNHFRLISDIWRGLNDATMWADERKNLYSEIRGWLDRQKRITIREHQEGCKYKAKADELQERVDSLTAEVEAQRKRANDAERGVLSEEWYVSRDRYEDDIAELTAERDYWRDEVQYCMDSAYPKSHAPERGYDQNVMAYPDRKGCATPSTLVSAVIDQLRDAAQDGFYASKFGDLVHLTAERDNLKSEIAKYEHDCGLLFDEKHKLEAENDKLREKAARLRKRVVVLECNLAHKQKVCDVQRESFLKLEAENAELRRALDGASDALDAI